MHTQLDRVVHIPACCSHIPFPPFFSSAHSPLSLFPASPAFFSPFLPLSISPPLHASISLLLSLSLSLLRSSVPPFLRAFTLFFTLSFAFFFAFLVLPLRQVLLTDAAPRRGGGFSRGAEEIGDGGGLSGDQGKDGKSLYTQRGRCAEIMFEHFKVPGLFISTTPVLSLYAAGRTQVTKPLL